MFYPSLHFLYLFYNTSNPWAMWHLCLFNLFTFLFEGNDMKWLCELTKLITMELCRLSVPSHFLASKTFHHGALGPTRPEANVIRKWKLGASGRALHSDWYDLELDPRRSNSLHWREISILKKVFKLLYVDLYNWCRYGMKNFRKSESFDHVWPNMCFFKK